MLAVITVITNESTRRNATEMMMMVENEILLADKIDKKKMKEMAKVSMTMAQNDEYFRRACKLPWNDPDLEFDCKEDSDKHDAEVEKTKKTVNRILESTEFMKETMSEDRHNTLECSWQGLTHYVSNKRSKNADTAFRENHWGSGKRIRDRGYKLALEEIKSRVIN